MCQHRRYIYNKYSHQHVLVDCGKCESCLQKKASARATRIRNNTDGNISLFVTLTYDNAGVPFIKKEDLESRLTDIPVYRYCSARRTRVGSSYDFKSRRKFGLNEIAKLHLDYDSIDKRCDYARDINRCRYLKHMPNKIGVCYYPDVQNFLKRLRLNLKRVYNYDQPFTSFQCSEYGGHSHRPHFHLLIFIPASAESTFRSAITQSWPYGNYFKSGKFIQIARDAASYVASYVNSANRLPKILEDSETKQKHSCSKSFGCSLDSFSLPKILEKADAGSLTYTVQRVREGKPCFDNLPLPQYVINRYFPRFKGYSRLASSEIIECLQRPVELLKIFSRDLSFYYDESDMRKFAVRQQHAFEYYNSVTGGTRIDYALSYVRVWQSYFKTVLQKSYDIVLYPSDWLSFYDNGGMLNHVSWSPNLTDYLDKFVGGNYHFEENPNSVLGNVEFDSYMSDLYRLKSKQKDVTNYVMSDGLGLDV